MEQSQRDLGVITALMERFEKQRLPRVLRIREQVGGGEKLSSADLEFLEQVLADAKYVKPLIDKHPEYQQLAAQAIDLYHEIAALALKNEQA